MESVSVKAFLNRYLVFIVLFGLLAVYSILVFLSEGTIGGADDITHYRYSRYAYQNPYFFLHHWGKPFFTAISSPFAQFGYNGIRIFNVLAGTAAAYFTYRMARILDIKYPITTIFLLISAPLYTMLMLSGMTEILFSLVFILSIFLFYKKQYIWSAIILSLLPFVRTEGVVILPLFFVAYSLQKQWKALPFLLFGFIFYSVAGSFYFKDILWVIHEMPYKGNANNIYGSGELLHYVKASKFIFGLPLSLMLLAGILLRVVDPFLKERKVQKKWLIEMLVIYLPAFVYFSAHSYVWWKGAGNSVGMIRVIAAIVPAAALLGALAWSRLMELIPLKKGWKVTLTVAMCVFLTTVPHRVYNIPAGLEGTQRLTKEASLWLKGSEYFENKIYYYDPFFCHFMDLNPYDKDRVREFVFDPEHPDLKIEEGEIVIWDAHFSPNEGKLPLENMMDSKGFRLIHLIRDKEPFTVLGGYLYEIYFFQRISQDDGKDNHELYQEMLEEILKPT